MSDVTWRIRFTFLSELQNQFGLKDLIQGYCSKDAYIRRFWRKYSYYWRPHVIDTWEPTCLTSETDRSHWKQRRDRKRFLQRILKQRRQLSTVCNWLEVKKWMVWPASYVLTALVVNFLIKSVPEKFLSIRCYSRFSLLAWLPLFYWYLALTHG